MKKHKRALIIVFIFSIFVFTIYYIIAGPTIKSYKFNENILNEVSIISKENLKNYVKILSQKDRTTIEGKKETVNYILETLKNIGINENKISIQSCKSYNQEYKNIIVKFRKNSKLNNSGKYIIGAHYDTDNNPGADDNASGVAGLFEIARVLNNNLLNKDVDLIFYANEEMPFFGTNEMGIYIHAKSIEKENVELVIVFDMIGYYSEKKDSQDFPIKFLERFYPNKGNFIAVVSNFDYIKETKYVKNIFKSYLKINKKISVESINAPATINGIDFSDHRNYWKFNIPSIMITDTSFYRNKNYHQKTDTFEKLDYDKLREVVISTTLVVLVEE